LNNRGIPAYVWLALAAVVLLSAFSIRKRTEVEAENRSVALAVEFESIEALAAGQGIGIDQALRDSQANGLRALVLNEETVGELISTGRASLIGQTPGPDSPTGLAIQFQDPSVIPQVQKGLRIRYGPMAGPLTVNGNILHVPPVSAQLLRSTPIGLNPREVASAKKAALEIVGRFANTGGESESAIAATLTWANQDGAKVFLPLGDEVLGFRKSTDKTLEELRSVQMLYATPEFAKIAGDELMVEKGKDIVVRLHTAQIAELDKLSPVDAVDRYVKAARERNMRILLVRPITLAGVQPYFEFNAFLKDISDQIVKNGQSLGEPKPFREPAIPTVLFPLLGLAIAPVVWFVASGFFQDRRVRIAGGVLLFILVLACYLKLGRELMALLGSMSFPILGFYLLDWLLPKLRKSEFVRILVGFWAVSALSLVGGICVAGMLNSLAFYVGAAQFQAVKVSVFMPIIFVGVHYFIRLTDWKKAMRSPMTWGATGLALGVGIVLAVMIARTGNDTGVGPSGGEIVFRNLLDRYL